MTGRTLYVHQPHRARQRSQIQKLIQLLDGTPSILPIRFSYVVTELFYFPCYISREDPTSLAKLPGSKKVSARNVFTTCNWILRD